jgi:hypothetical protein
MDAVLFGDIEDAFADYLNVVLDTPVFDKAPKETSSRLPFIVLSRIGGPKVSVVTEAATLSIESWANGDKTAHDNAQLARQAIHRLPGQIVNGIVISRVDEFSGPARLPAPESNKPRYVFTVSVIARGFASS